MKYHRIFAVAFAALISLPLTARWRSGNDKISDEPWRKGKKDFGAMLLLTPHAEKFYKEWSNRNAKYCHGGND